MVTQFHFWLNHAFNLYQIPYQKLCFKVLSVCSLSVSLYNQFFSIVLIICIAEVAAAVVTLVYSSYVSLAPNHWPLCQSSPSPNTLCLFFLFLLHVNSHHTLAIIKLGGLKWLQHIQPLNNSQIASGAMPALSLWTIYCTTILTFRHFICKTGDLHTELHPFSEMYNNYNNFEWVMEGLLRE